MDSTGSYINLFGEISIYKNPLSSLINKMFQLEKTNTFTVNRITFANSLEKNICTCVTKGPFKS